MKLKTIKEHDEEVLARHRNKHLSGIECPKCFEELQYEDEFLLLSNPPQRTVKCFKCGYRDTVYA